MSRSNPRVSSSPVTRRFEWKGDTGKLVYYDKEASENKEVGPPFRFITLDSRHGFTGFSDSAGSGIWSNHIVDFENEIVTARTSKGKIASGLYTSIKQQVENAGGQYGAFVYIAYKEESSDDLKIGVITFKGAAANAWIEFRNSHDINKISISITEALEGRKGAIKFKTPVFKAGEIAEKTNNEAIELDKQLQEYFNQSSVQNTEAPKQEFSNQDIPDEEGLSEVGKAEAFAQKDEDDELDLPF